MALAISARAAKVLGHVRILGQHARQGIIVQHTRLARLQDQGVFIGDFGLVLIADLVIGHAQRGKERSSRWAEAGWPG